MIYSQAIKRERQNSVEKHYDSHMDNASCRESCLRDANASTEGHPTTVSVGAIFGEMSFLLFETFTILAGND